MSKMIWLGGMAAVMWLTFPARTLLAQAKEAAIVQSASAVLHEIQAMPGRSIPQGMLAKAKAVAIIPNVIKIGFIVGGRHGVGVAVVRDASGTWGNPIFVSLTGGGVGFQAGVQSTDVVLVFNSPESVSGMLHGKFTLGADAAVAAGPVGRQATVATDIELKAEILSYSRSRGLFAGVSLDGSVLAVDHNANAVFYHVVGGTPEAIIAGAGIPVPPAAVELKSALAAQSGTPPSPTVAPVEMTAPDPAASVVAADLAPAAVSTPAEDPNEIRRQLASVSQQLGARLDQPWRNYLALPSSVFADGAPPPTPAAIRLSLGRFDKVERDPQFRVVGEMAEFQATLGLLRRYHDRLAPPVAPPNSPNLPPPPTTETGSAPADQSRY